jgi:Bacterial PH domain/Short C-terminal domain
MAEWKKIGKKAGKAYLTGGLSLAAEARRKKASSADAEKLGDDEAAARLAEVPEEGEPQGGAEPPVEPAAAEPEGGVALTRPDIAAAKERMSTKFGGRKELKKLDEYLWEDETVSRMATGLYAGKNGLLVLTDRRLIFLFHGWTGQRNEDFPLDTITSISAGSGIAMGSITVFSGGAKAEIKSINKADAKALADEVRNRLATRGVRLTDAAPQTAPPDVLAQLKQLGELHEAGVLTSEEFEAKKAELLKRL